jgi:hypothetical protein
MNRGEARSVLNEARRSLDELTRVLDAAAIRAVDIGADDALARIAAAKYATERGADCLARLQGNLFGPRGVESPNRHRSTPES